jgi:transcriptional regulator with XRE-family HTH domain
LDSNRLQIDRVLSAHQIRAARGLLGWSRRELAIVSRVSEGTIKAIELGMTDARLSTLRKLARAFSAHAVEFVADATRIGVTISNESDAMRALPVPKAQPAVRVPARNAAAEGFQESRELALRAVGQCPREEPEGRPRWFGPLMRAARRQRG